MGGRWTYSLRDSIVSKTLEVNKSSSKSTREVGRSTIETNLTGEITGGEAETGVIVEGESSSFGETGEK
jgi:hypothetical protein